MGFFGDFVLARSDEPLLELPVFGGEPACDAGHGDCMSMCWPRPGGWQTLQVHHGLPDNDDDRWLPKLVAATGTPVAIASVVDSDLCIARGLSPSGVSWSAALDPVMAVDYGMPVPAPVHDSAPPRESETERAVRWLLASAPSTAERIGAWAGEAGFTADREGLLAVLAKRADPFAEELFFELVDACGLPASTPAPADVVGETPAHPGR